MISVKTTAVQLTGLVLATLLVVGCASNPQDDLDRKSAARANVNLAAEYLRQNNLDKAREYFNKALKYQRGNQSALWGLAVTSKRTGHPDQARRYYAKALHRGHNPALLNSYAAFLCQQGQVEQAIPKFEKAANDPDYNAPAAALANAGLCLRRAGDNDRAETFLKKALQRNASQPLALAESARIAYTRGDILSARAYIERADSAASLDPEQLKLAARIELAAGHRRTAMRYVRRYNSAKGNASLTLDKLR